MLPSSGSRPDEEDVSLGARWKFLYTGHSHVQCDTPPDSHLLQSTLLCCRSCCDGVLVFRSASCLSQTHKGVAPNAHVVDHVESCFAESLGHSANQGFDASGLAVGLRAVPAPALIAVSGVDRHLALRRAG